MSRAPKRPETVPARSRWVPEANEWELGARDAQGRKRGAFTAGQPSGTWALLDATGAVLRTVEYGDPSALAAAPRLEAFADVGRSAEAWMRLAKARFDAGAVAEGLCLLARAAAAAKTPAPLLEALAVRAPDARRGRRGAGRRGR